jgi:hypothetical protein
MRQVMGFPLVRVMERCLGGLYGMRQVIRTPSVPDSRLLVEASSKDARACSDDCGAGSGPTDNAPLT